MCSSKIPATVPLLIISVWLLTGCAQYVGSKPPSKTVDISKAAIVVSASNPKHTKAAEMLQEEIEKRTGVRLAIIESMPKGGVSVIVLGTVKSLCGGPVVPSKAEGYAIWVDTKNRKAPIVYLVGRDDRGVLFAAGRLIRLAQMSEGNISIATDVRIATAPKYPLRGHMLIPDGKFIEWNAAGYEQYIRDLVIFGTNSFELNRPRSYVADILDSYGLDSWLFFGHGKVVDMKSIEDVEERFAELKGLDHVFIPLGDTSGVESTEVMIPATEHFAPLLRQVHPSAGIWLSHQNQQYHAENSNEYLFGYIQNVQPDWLEGMVYGPWAHWDIPGLREHTPKQYKIRHYPDICHNRRCQYPIPKWDRAFARVWGRNGIRTMPRMVARIHNMTAASTEGFIAYNHTGCNNDLDKFVFSAMAWDPNTDLNQMLREYGKVFFGDELADDVAQGLLMLEDNWTGPIAENGRIEKTLEHWKDIARRSGKVTSNWRVELFLYKAFIDAFTKRKYTLEMQYQEQAYKALKRADKDGVESAIRSARAALAHIDTEFPTKEQLKEELQSWGLGKYEDKELSEVLDNLYYAFNDRQWLEVEFEKILAMDDKAAQLAYIDRIVNWENPGPDGFYDNLGVEGKQPHLVRQKPWRDDPGYVHSPIEHNRHKPDSTERQSWLVIALTRYDTPLLMRYEGLGPKAKYRIRVVYSSPYSPVIRLVADGQYEVHGPLEQPKPIRPLEFNIPQQATADGNLNLQWQLMNLRRGVGVGEVWLIKQRD
jgi:hypothetical protein